MKKIEIITVITIVILGIALRLIPHAPNFAPVLAIALFAGVYFSKKVAIIFPLILIFVSDLFIGFYEPKVMAVVYSCFILSVVMGFWLKNHKKWHTILGSAVLGSVIFFVFTNFAVFIFTPWYPKTIFGLVECYTMALPFFRNTLLGDLFYTSMFFGAYEVANVLAKNKFREVIWSRK